MTYKEKIEELNLTEVGNKLKDMLYKIRNDDEFVYITLDDVKSDEKRQKMIELINGGKIKNGDGVIIASYCLKHNKNIRCSIEED